MSNTADDKIMGLIPKEKYMHIAYMFLVISAAGNALYALFGLIGIEFASAVPAVTLMGVLAVVMAAIGLTKHKDDFTAVEHAHFKYIAVLFLVFLVANVLIGGAVYAIAHFLGYLCTMAFGALQAVLVWTGYNSWQGGRVITKDNIKEEVTIALKNR